MTNPPKSKELLHKSVGDTDLGFFVGEFLDKSPTETYVLKNYLRFLLENSLGFVGDTPSRVEESFGRFRQIYFTTEDGDNAEVVSQKLAPENISPNQGHPKKIEWMANQI